MTIWTKDQEKAFQEFLEHYRKANDPVPLVLVKPFRAGFRARAWAPERIRNHRGLLPT